MDQMTESIEDLFGHPNSVFEREVDPADVDAAGAEDQSCDLYGDLT